MSEAPRDPGLDAASASARRLVADPRAAALKDNPYNLLTEVDPDTPTSQLHVAQRRLQSRGQRPEQRAAFRQLRDLTRRLLWDLRTLGTTPSIAVEEWRNMNRLLHSEEREAVFRAWIPRMKDPRTGDAALHVCAVLSAGDLAALPDGANGRLAVERFVAFWAALLWRRAWLVEFFESRCRMWKYRLPNQGDRAELRDRLEKWAVALLKEGARGHAEDGMRRWRREQAAIESVALALSPGAVAPWPRGFGPLGLELLGAAPKARSWLLSSSRRYRGGLAMSALRNRRARLDGADPRGSAGAASALQWLFSDLGEVAAHLWRGEGWAAWRCHRRIGGADRPDPWFGEGEGGRLRQQRARDEIEAEALLLRLQDELRSLELPPAAILEAARHALSVADRLRQPQEVVEQLEHVLTGRVLAALEARSLPPPDELRRLLDVSLPLRDLLLARGYGTQASLRIGQLFRRRAVRAWNRVADRLPSPKVREQVLQDMLCAADLAPYNAAIAADLGRVVLQLQHVAESTAERRSLLRLGQRYLDACVETSPNLSVVEDLRQKILEQLDPGLAMADARRRLREARQSANSEERGRPRRDE